MRINMEFLVLTIFIGSTLLSAGLIWLAMFDLFKLLNHVKAGWLIRIFAPTLVMFRISKDEVEARIKLSMLTKLMFSSAFSVVTAVSFIYLVEIYVGIQNLVER
jgi:hypothetical protein